MGLYFSKLFELFTEWNEGVPSRILLLGLDNAGKTTLLYKVKLNENVTTIPTIGFNVETVSPCKGITFTVWDIGGQYKIRALWRHYYQNTNGLFYIVDSSDCERLNESASELHGILDDPDMQDVPVVVIANKQDLPNALSCAQLVDKLNLRDLKNKWFIQSACTITGEGVFESMQKMSEFVKEKNKK